MKNDVNELLEERLYDLEERLESELKYNKEFALDFYDLTNEYKEQLIYEVEVYKACIKEVQKLISLYESKE